MTWREGLRSALSFLERTNQGNILSVGECSFLAGIRFSQIHTGIPGHQPQHPGLQFRCVLLHRPARRPPPTPPAPPLSVSELLHAALPTKFRYLPVCRDKIFLKARRRIFFSKLPSSAIKIFLVFFEVNHVQGEAGARILKREACARRRRENLEMQTSQVGFFCEKSSRRRFPNTIFLKENPFWEGLPKKKFAPAARLNFFYLGLQIA